MQISRAKQSVFTKVVRGQDGYEYVVSFLVIENEGGIDVKVLGAKKIDADKQTKTQIFLPVSKTLNSVFEKKISKSHSVVSPYFNIQTFFVSQPTRAPSLS